MTQGGDKAELRARCLDLRRACHDARPDAGMLARDHFLESIGFPGGAAVSAYLPVRDEFDVMPLAEEAARRGHVVGMPMVRDRNSPLVFLQWTPGCALADGVLGIPTPPPDSPRVVPDLLFVPMMAFDREGYRLGYGGGFYDRTLAALRRRNPATMAVGACFAGLEVDRVPRDDYDARLDWIVTEDGVHRVDRHAADDGPGTAAPGSSGGRDKGGR